MPYGNTLQVKKSKAAQSRAVPGVHAVTSFLPYSCACMPLLALPCIAMTRDPRGLLLTWGLL